MAGGDSPRGSGETLSWQLAWPSATLLVVTCTGSIDSDGAAALRSALVADVRLDNLEACVVDLREVGFGGLGGAALRLLATGRARPSSEETRRSTRIALVTGSARAYGLAKMYAALTAALRTPGRLDVFDDLGAALAWATGGEQVSSASGWPAAAR